MHKKQVKDILAELMAAEVDSRGKALSANQLALKSGIPQPTITRILNGESLDPDTATLRPLAEYFSVTVGQLRGEEPILRDPKIRRVVSAMEPMHEYQKDALVQIADTLAQSPPTKPEPGPEEP